MERNRKKVPLKRIFSVTALVAAYHYENVVQAKNKNMHALDCWQIHCQTKGMKTLTIEGESHLFRKGDTAFIAPGSMREMEHSHGKNDYLIISFESTSPLMHFFSNRVVTLTDAEIDMLQKLVYLGRHCAIDLHEENKFGFFRRESSPPELLGVFQSYLELFLSIVYNRLQNALNINTLLSDTPDAGQPLFVSLLKDYLNDHITENVTLEEISSRFFRSPTYIKKVFKSETGESIISYFSSLKIIEAKKLIYENKMNLQEISNYLSYSSPAHFSFAFKKHTGLTPSEYRKQHVHTGVHSLRSNPLRK